VRQARLKRGQELVEFALVLPLLLIVIMGALATANAVNASTQITQAAARAALDAANTNTTWCADSYSAAQTAIKEVVTSTLVTVTNITVDCDASNNGSHTTCSGDLSTDSCTSGAPPDTARGNLVTVRIDAQVSVAVFGTGPNLTTSSTGAAIVPRSS
jgi:Flp pilus assembly protein TadG